MLTSVNEFAFRSDILYLCTTEMEIAPWNRGYLHFFYPKNRFLGVKK